MSAADTHVHGSWNVICQRCGFKYKAEQVQEEWTGFLVCTGPGTNDCWEPRNQQDLQRHKPDQTKVAYVRNEARDQFVDVDYVADNVGVQE